MPSRSLVLFDIDGTLLRTEGVGIAAMLRAFTTLHGDRGFSFEGVEIAGALDGLLFRRLMEAHGLLPHDEAHEKFRETYRAELDRTLTPAKIRRMPGAAELAAALDTQGAAVGLLTGNYEETAQIKIRAAGYNHMLFPFGAFGADGPSRRHLTPVAMARAAAHHVSRSSAIRRSMSIARKPTAAARLVLPRAPTPRRNSATRAPTSRLRISPTPKNSFGGFSPCDIPQTPSHGTMRACRRSPPSAATSTSTRSSASNSIFLSDARPCSIFSIDCAVHFRG
jgi:phosphoglycolate phosphatase-like HAD superfamily hydrolase